MLTSKFNSSGTLQWAQVNDVAGYQDVAVKLTVTGGTVYTSIAVQTSSVNYAMGVAYYNASTGSVTGSAITSTLSTVAEVVTGMAQDALGNIYITGTAHITGQGIDFFTVKFNSSLAVVWSALYNGTANLDDVSKGVKVDAAGNVYVSGYTTASGAEAKNQLVIKYNSSGVQQWLDNSHVNGDDEATDLVLDAAGNLYTTGYRTDNTINHTNYYTAKYNSSATKLWEMETDGATHSNDFATNIALDTLNHVIVTGQSETTTGVYQYLTTKYVQHDVITPTDFNGESTGANFNYYENRGQLISTNDSLIPEVKLYTHNTNPLFYFKDNTQSFVFAKIDTSAITNDTLHRIDISFDNSNNLARTYAMDKLADNYLNYFLAHTDSSGVTGILANKRLITPNLYNNIDLMCSSNQNGIKYYFIVKPGGDIRDINLNFSGASSFNLNGTTNALTINSSIGSLTFDRPTVYQLTAANATVAVTGWTADWQTNGGSNKYKFNHGAYTSSLTLIVEVDQGNGLVSSSVAIDNLNWCTYYGGASDDVFYDVKTNNSNNVWVTGSTISANFPVVNFYQGTNAGNRDAIFVKFTNTGSRLWSTYIGGSLEDTDLNRHGIEVDNSGNCFSAFKTASTNFPTNASGIAGAYYDNINSAIAPHDPADVAIVSLNNSGQLIWSTYFGGNGWIARSYDIGLDNNNNLIVTGIDNGFPLLHPTGSYQNTFPIASGGAYFIAKFNPNHNLVWSSFYGSNGPIIEKVAFNSHNDIFVVGEVNNETGAYFDAVDPGSGAFFNNTFNGGATDGFIAKFDGTTNDLVWSTFYGGNEDDKIHAVTVDNYDNIYISGETTSSSGLITGNVLGLNNTTYGGAGSFFSLPIGDGLLAKFGSSNQLISSTYFGGAANEGSFDIFYKNNFLFIPFVTAGNDMPFASSNPTSTFVQSANSTGQDVSNDGYFAVMDKNFNFEWSSYFGGSNTSTNALLKQDIIFANTVSNDNKYYIVGVSASNTGFPIVNATGAYNQSTNASTQDGFIAQFSLSSIPVSINTIKKTDNEMLVYPNPTNDEVNIYYPNKDKYSIEIMDIMGRRIYFFESRINAMSKIDVTNIAKGAYLIKVAEGQNLTVQKLIIN